MHFCERLTKKLTRKYTWQTKIPEQNIGSVTSANPVRSYSVVGDCYHFSSLKTVLLNFSVTGDCFLTSKKIQVPLHIMFIHIPPPQVVSLTTIFFCWTTAYVL